MRYRRDLIYPSMTAALRRSALALAVVAAGAGCASPSPRGASADRSPSQAAQPRAPERATPGPSDRPRVDGDTVRFRYAWPREAKVSVNSTVIQSRIGREDRRDERSFELIIQPRDEGVAIEQHGLLPRDLAGVTLDSRSDFHGLMASLYVAVPTLLIDADGSLAGTRGADELAARSGDALSRYLRRQGAPARKREAILRALSPRMFRLRGTELWAMLVDNLRGRQFQVGQRVELEVDNLMPRALGAGTERGSSIYEVARGVDCGGGLGGDDRCVRLRVLTRLDTPKARAALGNYLTDATPRGATVTDTEISLAYQLITDPETLRPRELVIDQTYAFQVEDRDGRTETREKSIQRAYAFAWGTPGSRTHGSVTPKTP